MTKRFMSATQKPLELILARNLLTSISTPSFLVDGAGTMVFYNEAAAALLGRSFEDAGQMTAEEWTAAFGPLSNGDQPFQLDDISLTQAIQSGQPAHGSFCIRTARSDKELVEAAAFPLVTAAEGATGAMVMFWPKGVEEDQ